MNERFGPPCRRVSILRTFGVAATLAVVAATALGARPVSDATSPIRAIAATAPNAAAAAGALLSPAAWTRAARGSIDPSVFDLALGAASCAVRSGDVSNPSTLTVIDYSK